MFEYIKGKLVKKGDIGGVIEVNGIGFYLFLTKETLDSLEVNNEYIFFTHLTVKDDGYELYGFRDEKEREIFLSLLSVHNVGEKSALNILSSLGYKKLIEALQQGEYRDLLSVKGIGERTAKRIILELKGKISFKEEKLPQDAILGLVKLGFTKKEAEEKVKNIIFYKKGLTTEEIIKEVLSQ